MTDVRKFDNIYGVVYTLKYYNSRVQRAIESWPVALLARYAHVAELLQRNGPELGMPHSRALGDGLFELRLTSRDGAGRIFYCFLVQRQVVIVHALIKKSQATPEHELRIARERIRRIGHEQS